ncbi:unnamed protein product [Lota lota]
MRTGLLFSAVLVPLAALLVSMVAGADDERATKAATHHPTVSVPVSNSTNSSSTSPPHRGVLPRGLNVDNMVIQRALYVLIGFTMLGVFYLLVRAVRMKRPLQKKKYGLLKNCDDVVELDPLESEEDDTLYEASALRR